MGLLMHVGIVLAVVTMAGTAVWLHSANLQIHARIQLAESRTAQLKETRQARQEEVNRIKREIAEMSERRRTAADASADADSKSDTKLPPVLHPRLACVEAREPDIIQLNRDIRRNEDRIKELRKAAGPAAPPPNPFGPNLDKEVKVGNTMFTANKLVSNLVERNRTEVFPPVLSCRPFELSSTRTGTECNTEPPAATPSPQNGLYQYTYELPKLTSIPLVGGYWYPEIDRGCNTDYARILGEDPMIALGDTSSCKVVDVVWQREQDKRCTVIFRQPCHWQNFKYDDFRKDNTFGASSSYSVKLDENGEATLPKTPPMFSGYPGISWRDAFLPTFMERKFEIVKALIEVIGVSGQSKYSDALGGEPIVVMNTNHGHAGLVINFFCLLRSLDIPMPRHVIFTTDPRLRDSLTALGLTSFYHPGLGKYPKKASAAYGDADFGKQMNMKQFCVYITLLTGHDVLFQDVDVFWLKDPIPGLQAQSMFHHFQFMDDGARTFRFAPLFANSGFFYVKNHPTSIRFWDMVTMTMAFGQTGNQEVVNPVMEYYAKRRGFKPRILPPVTYMSGMHISPKGGSSLFRKNETEVIHFCWTHNFDSKFEKISAFKTLRVTEECIRNIDNCKFGPNGEKVFQNTDAKVEKEATAEWYNRCPSL